MEERWRKPGAQAILLALLGGIASSLQGCSLALQRRKTQSPLEVCPPVKFGDGYVAESRAGELVRITCPRDYVYRGPAIECSWVDRFCVAYEEDEVNPDFCWNQYNLTLEGRGLSVWPEGLPPHIVAPPTSGFNKSTPVAGPQSRMNFSTMQAAIAAGRRLESGLGSRLESARLDALPRIVQPEQISCKDEAYTDLDFSHARIVHSNLGGYGPDQGAPTLQYKGIATFRDQKVDMIVSTDLRYHPGDSKLNGKGSAMGRISMNGTHAAPLKFQFVNSLTQQPMYLTKLFFTLFDVSSIEDAEHQNMEVVATGVREYFVSRKTAVPVRSLNGSSYLFGHVGGPVLDMASGTASGVGLPEDPGHLGNKRQANVKDLWLDSINRTVVLMFRDVSEFTLMVKVEPGPLGRNFEFTGYSEVVGMGRKVVLEDTAGFQAQFDIANNAPVLDPESKASVLLACAGLVALMAALTATLVRWARRPRAQYGVLLTF
jgi:hypothetical protein